MNDLIDELILLKYEKKLTISNIYGKRIPLLESDEEHYRIIQELINKGCLILESKQINQVINGREIPILIEKNDKYHIYEWSDTKEKFTITLDDIVMKTILYDMYLILNEDIDIKMQITKFVKNFNEFTSEFKLSDILQNLKNEKKFLFSRYVEEDRALKILDKANIFNLRMRMEEINM